MNWLGKLMFLVSSYAPLWLLIGVRFRSLDPSTVPYAPSAEKAFYIISFASVLVFFLLLRSFRRASPVALRVRSYSRKDDHILSYIVTYFPPLFSLNLGQSTDIASLIIIYATAAVVYVRLDAFYVNPLFALFGYRIYEVCGEKETVTAIISSRASMYEGKTLKGPKSNGVLFMGDVDEREPEQRS